MTSDNSFFNQTASKFLRKSNYNKTLEICFKEKHCEWLGDLGFSFKESLLTKILIGNLIGEKISKISSFIFKLTKVQFDIGLLHKKIKFLKFGIKIKAILNLTTNLIYSLCFFFFSELNITMEDLKEKISRENDENFTIEKISSLLESAVNLVERKTLNDENSSQFLKQLLCTILNGVNLLQQNLAVEEDLLKICEDVFEIAKVTKESN